ncbi:MAG: transcriptional repressor [Pyrinomonadaceae bacterium]|nr:transcriptional repressor [Pyrinomonadaceae bacterium]MCX7640744.1 transcriptional repressor [Pyrinomonadaceae bacterium]MDW8304639.1 transcriptional repressor [Acidobacteriota bacterium]
MAYCLTKQRQVILQVIRQSEEHLTANEIYLKAKQILPTISFATVYNSLKFLKDAGLIAEIKFADSASRFDKKVSRHDHAICTKCGKLIDIELSFPQELVEMASKLSGFKPKSFGFTLHGLCPTCDE